MRPNMFALLITLASIPAVAQSAQDIDPNQTQVHQDAAVELERIRALIERMRRDWPDSGTDRKCTQDAGTETNEP